MNNGSVLNRFFRDIPPAAGIGVSAQKAPAEVQETPENPPSASNGALDRSKPDRIEAKVRLHRKLIDELNLATLERMPKEELRRQIGEFVAEYVRAERILLNGRELETFATEVFDELTGLGPLEPLLKDPTVSDILINTHQSVYVERHGKLTPVATAFKDEAHLLRIVNKIVAAVGRRVDESQPMIDARLADGSRVNVAVRPVAVDGPLVSIRKFAEKGFDLGQLTAIGSLTGKMAEFLGTCVRGRVTVLISGGTGSGKTTLLNAMSSQISHSERLITIEDAAELRLLQPHVGRLETRPPNLEGKGEIRQRELVKNALRMRPDRIILGEVRGEEAFDMLQAMNTGHEGSMATIHANSPRDAISRLAQMIGMAGLPMSEASIRMQIASAIRLIVQLQRFSDGRRRIVSIAEISGMEREVIQMQEIFKFTRTATSEDGITKGYYSATGLRPMIMEDLLLKGFSFPGAFFDPAQKEAAI
jgi:pilus assembly protein CpaF